MLKDAKLAHVNLSTREIDIEIIPAKTYRLYPGGSVLGTYLMMRDMDPTVSALSPDNLLIFTVSPLTGLPVGGLSRMCVTTKSPASGGIADSQVGGFIPAQLKANGYDGIVISGKASSPLYIFIDKDKIELRDADKLWGKTTGETEDIIKSDLGERIELAVIGQGGENLVNYAAIIHRKSRACGRCGTGAVMGSKNLKAIAVKNQPPIKDMLDPEGVKTLTSNVRSRIEANETVEDIGINGTASTIDYFHTDGALPSYNWRDGYMPGADKIGAVALADGILKGRDTCYACAIRCKRVVDIPGKADPSYGGPEYETLATFGSYCGNTDVADICEANMLCNMYGLDTISTGAVIAFAMDCYEQGLITDEDTGGIDLSFGNGKSFAPMIEKIVFRENGLGNLLAKGSEIAAKEIGNGAEDLAVTTKNIEWPAHMPQQKPSLAVVYAVNNFGADHQSSEHDPVLMSPEDSEDWRRISMLGKFESIIGNTSLDKNKVRLAWESQKFYSVLDSLCLCQFVWGPSWQLYGPDDLLNLCKWSLGWDLDMEELQKIGARRITMMRLFNIKTGMGKSDDRIPAKALIKLPNGPYEGAAVDNNEFLIARDYYYELAGWDTETTMPLPETLRDLGIDWAV
jgi:aldehyde:ferredoxin oxidoreductase